MKKSIKIFCIMALAMLCIVMGSVRAQAADVTLKDGKWAKGVLKAHAQELYYKINVKKTGYIKVDYVRENKDEFINLNICNSKKKTLEEVDQETFYFAVKKGSYYVQITDIAATDDLEEYDWVSEESISENYKIRYTFTAMKNKKNPTNAKKAPSLKKNKQVCGLVFREKKVKNIIYKLTLAKKTKVKFEYEIMSSNDLVGLWLRIADRKGKFMNFDSKGNVKKDKESAVWWQGKGNDFVILPKGTYYFVIQPSSGYSGYYKLKLSW